MLRFDPIGFRPGMQVKQFGFAFDEVLKLADKFSDAAAIVRVRIPRSTLDALDLTHVDATFLSGSVTVHPEQLQRFNDAIVDGIEHVY